jgi:hypothetical protein
LAMRAEGWTFARIANARQPPGSFRTRAMRRDKGGTGIPKPAGAGGGSSSSSSEPFGGPTRLNNREITLGLRPLFAIPSAVRRAFIKRKERQNLVDLSDSAATEPAQRGAFSIARASEITTPGPPSFPPSSSSGRS